MNRISVPKVIVDTEQIHTASIRSSKCYDEVIRWIYEAEDSLQSSDTFSSATCIPAGDLAIHISPRTSNNGTKPYHDIHDQLYSPTPSFEEGRYDPIYQNPSPPVTSEYSYRPSHFSNITRLRLDNERKEGQNKQTIGLAMSSKSDVIGEDCSTKNLLLRVAPFALSPEDLEGQVSPALSNSSDDSANVLRFKIPYAGTIANPCWPSYHHDLASDDLCGTPLSALSLDSCISSDWSEESFFPHEMGRKRLPSASRWLHRGTADQIVNTSSSSYDIVRTMGRSTMDDSSRSDLLDLRKQMRASRHYEELNRNRTVWENKIERTTPAAMRFSLDVDG